jgi:hypothetical protein
MNAASGRSARQPGRLRQGREDERHDAGGRDGDAKQMTLHGEPPLDVMTRAASYGDGVGGSPPGCGPSDTSAAPLHAAAADGCKFHPDRRAVSVRRPKQEKTASALASTSTGRRSRPTSAAACAVPPVRHDQSMSPDERTRSLGTATSASISRHADFCGSRNRHSDWYLERRNARCSRAFLELRGWDSNPQPSP